MKFLKPIGDFFKGRVGLVVLGFILTTVCGALINGMYSCSSWNRDKQFELLKGEVQKDDELLADLGKQLGMRTFRVQRVLWAMDADANPAPDKWQLSDDEKKKLNALWDDYYQSVIDWNISYRNYAVRIRLLAGDEIADKFFVGEAGGTRKSKADTLSWQFEHCHEVAAAQKKAALASGIDRLQHEAAQRDLDQLYNKVDDFVSQLYRALNQKVESANLLKPIQTRH